MVEKKKKQKPIPEDKKKYVCNICGKECANPSALKMHKKWKHSADSDGGGESFREEERGSEGEGEKDDGWVPW